MIKIGLTGGIGSGKSIVGELLQIHQIPLYIADKESKRLTNESPLIREPLIQLFGADIYLSTGELNKQKLAAIIFKDEKALKAVNAIIHPVVRADFLNWAKQQQATCCAIESAILFDSGLDKDVDIRLMIYAPLELRIQRAIERDGANREAIIQRINNQLPEEEVRQKCDYIINNDDENLLIPQMEAFLDRFKLR